MEVRAEHKILDFPPRSIAHVLIVRYIQYIYQPNAMSKLIAFGLGRESYIGLTALLLV
jgi:hypothetical protein